VLGSSPRSALYKICANKKIGESEGKKDHHHPWTSSRSAIPCQKKKKRDAGEIPAAHLKKKSRVECECEP